MSTVYKAQTFNLSSLNGISDGTLAMHFKLYEGYVTNTNLLNDQIAELSKGEISGKETKLSSASSIYFQLPQLKELMFA